MGINIHTLKFLTENKDLIKGKKVLMIGRQSLYTTKEECKKYNLTLPSDKYSENIWLELGAKTIQSIDGNDYEQASFIHDMNLPISKKMKGKFDIIFDGGSSEHIFNFPQALNNYKLMLSKKGYYIGVLPTNNHSNHGFYQFSPDLFYRYFSKENGYKTSIFMNDGKIWAYIKDIITLGSPNNSNLIMSKKPTLMYVISQKIKSIDNTSHPIQTIYLQHLWNKDTQEKIKHKTHYLTDIIKKVIPNFINLYIHNRITLSKIIINTNDLNFHRNIKGK